jgi:cytochrome c peroxidase
MPVIPADNPMSVAKVDLGRRLFHDTRLSGNRTFSCASCHEQGKAFTDGRAQAIGSTGAVHPRSSMSLVNVAYNVAFGWADASVDSLEKQMAVPMFNEHPVELGLSGRQDEVVARFAANPADRARFAAAFPGEAQPLTFVNVVKAVAAFERTIVSGDSPLDRCLYRDDRSALSPEALRGMTLFFSPRLGCSECHSGFNLSGPARFEGAKPAPPVFHNTGLFDADRRGASAVSDRGLIDVTHLAADVGKFRAPTLRNIEVTAPYMHDGSVPTLEAVIDHYASGGHRSRFVSPRVKPFTLHGTDRADLVAFLVSLTDSTLLTRSEYAR